MVLIFLAVVFAISFFIVNSYMPTLVITPGILCLLALAQYGTGVACRFKPYVYGAFIHCIGAVLCIVCYYFNGEILQFAILALCMIFAFIIPGHIANKKAEQDV